MKVHKIEIKNTFVFFKDSRMGIMPYKNYNMSMLKLSSKEILKFIGINYDTNAFLVVFFASHRGDRYGFMSWIGLISYNQLNNLIEEKTINDNLWIIAPHLLQNDLGPKCADLRLFKLKNNIGIIGYSRLSNTSNKKGMPDYYVRSALLNIRINNKLFETPKKLFSFKLNPSKIGSNYKKFKINSSVSHTDKEFYIVNNKYAKNIIPHKTKNAIKLNGIEIAFNSKDKAENYKTHFPRKNIVPLQHNEYLDKIGCFVDFHSPTNDSPQLTILNMENGMVLKLTKLNIDKKFKTFNFFGSTPFIQIHNNLWTTIVHDRKNNKEYKYGLQYLYKFLFFNSMKINVKGKNIIIPNQCIDAIDIKTNKIINNEFIFIMGLIVDNLIEKDNCLIIDFIISYGISDSHSGITKINIVLNA